MLWIGQMWSPILTGRESVLISFGPVPVLEKLVVGFSMFEMIPT